jgi:hypothetical protein
MEATSDGKMEIDSRDKAKKKRSWGSAFYTFLSSGGIIVLLLVGFVLVIVISVLIK